MLRLWIEICSFSLFVLMWMNSLRTSSCPTVFWHELDGKMGHVGAAETQKSLCDTFTCSTELFSHGPQQQPPSWPNGNPGASLWMTSHTLTHSHILHQISVDTKFSFIQQRSRHFWYQFLVIVKWNWAIFFSLGFHFHVFV